MGTRMPSRSSRMSALSAMRTAGDAPSVRKIVAGSTPVMPSRAMMKSATSWRTSMLPRESWYAPTPPLNAASTFFARAIASGGKIWLAAGWSSRKGAAQSASTWRVNVIGWQPSWCGLPTKVVVLFLFGFL